MKAQDKAGGGRNKCPFCQQRHRLRPVPFSTVATHEHTGTRAAVRQAMGGRAGATSCAYTRHAATDEQTGGSPCSFGAHGRRTKSQCRLEDHVFLFRPIFPPLLRVSLAGKAGHGLGAGAPANTPWNTTASPSTEHSPSSTSSREQARAPRRMRASFALEMQCRVEGRKDKCINRPVKLKLTHSAWAAGRHMFFKF